MRTSTLQSFFICFAACFLALQVVSSQAPQWNWLASGGGSDIGLSYATSVAVDNQGNSYVTGLHGQKVAVQKFSPSGTLLWTTKAEYGNILDLSRDIAVDAQGNVYITGSFYDSCKFGNTVLVINDNAFTEFAAFLVKLDNNGVVQWAIRAGASTGGQSVAVLPSGNVAFAGSLAASSGSVSLGNLSAPIPPSGGRNYFLALVSADGTPQWIKAMNAESVLSSDYGIPAIHDLQTDASGNIYGTGFIAFGAITATTLNFGGISLTGLGVQSVVFKCNSSGQMQWVKHSTSSNTSKKVCGQGLGLDNNGNVYVAGWSEEGFSFGSVSTSNTELQPYVAKFNNDGDVQWVKSFGKTFEYDPAKLTIGLATAADGDCYVSGWLITYTSNPVDFGDGNVISGIPPGGFSRDYIVKVNNTGQTQWVKMNLEMVQGDDFKNIAIDPAENAYLCGSWISGTGYDGLPAPAPPYGIFVAKLGNAAISVAGQDEPGVVLFYPNPASDRVFWEADAGFEVTDVVMSDLMGKTVLSKRISPGQKYLDLVGLPSGVYLISLKRGEHFMKSARVMVMSRD